MKKMKKILALLFITTAFGLYGCNITYQPTQGDFDDVVEAVLSAATITNISSVVYSVKDSIDIKGMLTDNNTCPQLTLEGDIGSRTLTINYAEGCEAAGISLSGEASGSWEYETGSLDASMTLSAFQVQDMSADGSVALQATFGEGQGVALNVDADITTNGQTLAVNDLAAAVNLNGTPLDPDDDTYTLAGGGTYTNQDGNRYSVTIKDVTAAFKCFVPTQGTMILKSTNPLFTAKVDFGSGTCDTIITVTIGLQKQEIDLADWAVALQ